MEGAIRRREEELKSSVSKYEHELSDLNNAYTSTKEELQSRPPISFESLIEKIGLVADYDYSSDKSANKKISWNDLEM